MAISFVNAGAQSLGNSSPLSPALPTSHAAGDLLLLICFQASASGITFTPPAGGGWTSLASNSNATRAATLQVFWKKEGASEAAPSVACGTPLPGWCCQIAGYRGGNVAVPEDAADVPSDAAAAATFQPTQITTVLNDAMVLSVVGTKDDNALNLSTANSFNVRMSGASYDGTTGNGSDYSIGLADVIKATAGAQTCPTWNQTVNGNDAWVALTIALTPLVPITSTPDIATPAVTGYAPTVTPTLNILSTPAAATPAVTGYVPTVSISDIDSNLELYYKLNGDLTDSCGHSSATWAVGTPTYVAGKVSGMQAASFASARIDMPSIGSTTDVATFSWWMKPTLGSSGTQWVNDGAQHVTLSQKAWSANGHFFIQFYSWFAQITMPRYGYADIGFGYADYASWPAGQWTHIAITYDKTKPEVRLYANGVQVGTTHTGALDTLTDVGYSIGAWETEARSFDGLIERVRIYSRVLSAGDILKLANNNPVEVTPVAATPAVTGYAPTVTPTLNILSTPAAATPAVTGYVPTIELPIICTPDQVALDIAEQVPTIELPVICTPANATLTLGTSALASIQKSDIFSILAHYYGFDEGNGTVLLDSYGGPTFVGSVFNGASWTTAQRGLYSFVLDGADAKASVAQTFGGLQYFTIALWVKANIGVTSDFGKILSAWDGLETERIEIGVGGSGLGSSTDNDITVAICNGSDVSIYTQDHPLADGAWHHVVVLYDGTQATEANRLKLYIDSTLKTVATQGSGIPEFAPDLNDVLFYLGARVGDTYPFNGGVDDLVMYERILNTRDMYALSLWSPVPVTSTPDAATLTLTPYEPTVSAIADIIATPDAVALEIAEQVPTIELPIICTPDQAVLDIAEQVPTVTALNGIIVTPAAATPAVTGYVPTVSISDIDSNLEMYYKLNGDLTDSANGRTASWTVGTPTYAAGHVSGAQAASLVTSRIDTPAIGATQDNMTWAWWMLPTANGAPAWDNTGHSAIFGTCDPVWSGEGYISLQFWDWFAWALIMRAQKDDIGTSADKNLWPGGSWSHVALTYDKGAGELRIYVNGLQAGAAMAATLDTIPNKGWSIGTWAASERYYKGLVQQFRIYSRTLSAGDILKLANNNPVEINPAAASLDIAEQVPTVSAPAYQETTNATCTLTSHLPTITASSNYSKGSLTSAIFNSLIMRVT